METINEHPDYKNVPIEERNINYRALRDVLPKTENIKTRLLEQYTTEYMLYQEQKVNILKYFNKKKKINKHRKKQSCGVYINCV